MLNGAVWDADVLRDEVRSYAVAHLGDADAALILDDTQVIKKGVKSVGVAPQHCGLTGQTENCQAWMMGTYASVHGHAFVDRECTCRPAGATIRTGWPRPGCPRIGRLC